MNRINQIIESRRQHAFCNWRVLLSELKNGYLPRRKKGQGLMEYIFIIAFVSLLIAFCFGFGSGSLMFALSQSHSRIVGEFDRINNETQRITDGR